MEASIVTRQRELIIKPFDYSQAPEDIEILTSLSPKAELLEWLKENNVAYQIIDFNGIQCCVAHHDLYFYDSPQKAKSPGSKALYIARSKNKFDGLLLQYLLPGSITSKHYHAKRIETYYGLEGKCIVNICGKDHELKKSVLIVSPYSVHQVRTLEEPSLTLIDMSKNGSCLSMEDHNYV